MILDPVPTGDLVEVPYYPGHCYAAYLGNSSTQVILALQYIKNLMFLFIGSRCYSLQRKTWKFALSHLQLSYNGSEGIA